MRHGRTINHLGRHSAHRKALLSNMATSLILHKRIETTVAKAKELRKFVEPLLTRSKDDSTHSRRTVFAYLRNKEGVKELYNTVADKVANRQGGYTRIIKLGTRKGDNAEMCLMELVDFNEVLLGAAKPAKKASTRRGRRGAGAATSAAPAEVVQDMDAVEAPAVDAAAADTTTPETSFEAVVEAEPVDTAEATPAQAQAETDATASSETPETSSEATSAEEEEEPKA